MKVSRKRLGLRPQASQPATAKERGFSTGAAQDLTGFTFWAALVIAVISMLINSAIAEAEDEAPGGINNPPPPTKPLSFE